MAASLPWKVYLDGEYIAAFFSPYHAAILVGTLGKDTQVRYGHKLVVWYEDVDGQASESYDTVAETCLLRLGESELGRHGRARG